MAKGWSLTASPWNSKISLRATACARAVRASDTPSWARSRVPHDADVDRASCDTKPPSLLCTRRLFLCSALCGQALKSRDNAPARTLWSQITFCRRKKFSRPHLAVLQVQGMAPVRTLWSPVSFARQQNCARPRLAVLPVQSIAAPRTKARNLPQGRLSCL